MRSEEEFTLHVSHPPLFIEQIQFWPQVDWGHHEDAGAFFLRSKLASVPPGVFPEQHVCVIQHLPKIPGILDGTGGRGRSNLRTRTNGQAYRH